MKCIALLLAGLLAGILFAQQKAEPQLHVVTYVDVYPNFAAARANLRHRRSVAEQAGVPRASGGSAQQGFSGSVSARPRSRSTSGFTTHYRNFSNASRPGILLL